MRQDSEIVLRGVFAGYLVDALQLSTGPGDIITRGWDTYERLLDRCGGLLRTFKTLRHCPWCLTPYVSLMVWLPGRPGGFRGLLGVIGVCGMAAKFGQL